MSGPNDSGVGETAGGDFTLPLGDAVPQFSPRFRLRVRWETPHLEWRPTPATRTSPLGTPALLKLDDPFAAVLAFERYILSGSLLFDMKRMRFDLLDKAYIDAPTVSPSLMPSFAQMKAWEDDAFYRRLGRTAPLFGAPATPAPLLTPPLLSPAPLSPFYKLPSPAAMAHDPTATKAGSFGDVLKALDGLPIVQENKNKLIDYGLRQVQLLKTDWDKAPWRDRIPALVLTATLGAGLVGTVMGADDARHLALNQLKGADIPAPFVPGLSFHVTDFGKADRYLLGPKDDSKPHPLEFGVKFDLLEAIPALKKMF
jgi:hypothetical protein